MTSPQDIIRAALNEGRTTLFEHEAKELVRSSGIMTPKSVVVSPHDHDAILAAAEKLGYPVVLKAESPQILHKTDAGAIMLNIASAAGLSASISTMKNTIASRMPGAELRFYFLEKMMPPGLELLIGALRDEQFGPALSFGLGGVWVEALKDAAFGILPMTRAELLDLIGETKAGMFLRGFRGSPALDEEATIAMLNAMAGLMAMHPGIREIECNPVRVYAKGAFALDVRVVLG